MELTMLTTRRRFNGGAAGLGAAPDISFVQTAPSRMRRLRAIMHADLRIFAPVSARASIKAMVAASDRAGGVTRRSNCKPPAQGSRTIFVTAATGHGFSDPVAASRHAGTGEIAWFAWHGVHLACLGQIFRASAWRKTMRGMITIPDVARSSVIETI
jgi:hypothetical protein